MGRYFLGRSNAHREKDDATYKAQKSEAYESKTFLMVETPKSYRSQRVIPLPSFLVEKLSLLKKTNTDSIYVFATQSHMTEPRTIQRRF